jgi:SAM-dependent methyltransferase
MAGRGWEIIAADIAPYAMRLCRNASPSAAVSCIVADGRSLPFRDRSFDGVLAWHVLGHVVRPERDRMAGEILRVLRPEGTLFFRGFAVGDMRYGKGREIEPGTFRRGNGIATHYFTEPEIRMLFPGFSRHTLRTEQWILRVRGSTLLRTEIAGTFTKGDEE